MLYIQLPVMEEDFLLTTVETILKDIMNTVSGQFIEYNKDNGQYFLDLKKDVDYDKKIQEKADFLGRSLESVFLYSHVRCLRLELKRERYRTENI